ncbi:hypothetical protein KAW18_09660 [candidate division WOR-3 bacterium]|nr:hypothetical protein [candidate division WOR-3 bacterium]
MRIIKYSRSKILHRLPGWLKLLLYKTWRCYWRIRVKLLPDRYHVDPYTINETIYVNTDRIEYAVKEGFDIYHYKGRVLSGDWDKDTVRFEDLDFFKSYHKKVENNIPWSETGYYKRVLEQIKTGEVKWGCKDKEELDERCSKLDEIFNDMKCKGYKEGWNENEISVNIGRDGEILFNNGRHRLTFAKLLNIEKVPVRITIRHTEWVEFKKEIFGYSKKFNNKVYALLTHPDLQHIPSHYDDTRFKIIKNHLTVDGGTLLDIGGHWGYFCHRFEDEGFECYCVENSNLNLYFLNRLKESETKNFKVIPQSIFDLPEGLPKKYNVVLALSVFHHFIKEEKTCKKFIEFLGNLKTHEMFFEPHNPDEPQMKRAYRNFRNEEFADFIVRNSALSKFEMIGLSEHGRTLYRIS